MNRYNWIVSLALFFLVFQARGNIGSITASCGRDGCKIVSPSQSDLQRMGTDSLRYLVGLGFDWELLRANGRAVSLQALLDQARQIKFEYRQAMYLTNKNSNVRNCIDNFNARWLLAKDAPARRPTIAVMSTFGGGLETEPYALRDLYIHETISALGFVDDTCQVSCGLKYIADYARENRVKNKREIPRSFFASPVLDGLKDIKKYEQTPRFKIGPEFHCYGYDNRLLKNNGGSTTGIGGGGDTANMFWKPELYKAAPHFWQKNKHRTNMSYARFIKHITNTGIEPLGRQAKSSSSFFGCGVDEILFDIKYSRKSKISKRPAISFPTRKAWKMSICRKPTIQALLQTIFENNK